MSRRSTRRSDAAAATTAAAINHLSAQTSATLRSSLVIPTLAQILSELAQNSLDAGAKRIDVWINVAPGDESLRVQDDGVGMSREQLGRIGERYVTSKGSATSVLGDTYGFRGEALASIGALCLLEVTSRAAKADTFARVIKNGNIIYTGKARDTVTSQHGTTVSVRDVFAAVPVRQAALGSGALTACRKVLETLALAWPAVAWSLWEERPSGARKVLGLRPAKNSLGMFKAVYGSAGVEKVQSVRVSSGQWRVDGFISLEGAVTKAHQHLYVNGFPLDTASELHLAIARRFASSAFATTAGDWDERPQTNRASPRRPERYPIYVLNVTVPPEGVDATYDPKKRQHGYRDAGRLTAFVVTVADEFLQRAGFGRREAPSERTPTKGSPLVPAKRRAEEGSERIATRLFSSRAAPDTASPEPVDDTNDPFGRRWIRDIVTQPAPNVFPVGRGQRGIPPADDGDAGPDDNPLEDDDNPTLLTTALRGPLSDVTFSHDSLADAVVLGQVDRKFICCVLRAETPTHEPTAALVILDQHAADERAAVEGIMDELCAGFAGDTMAVTDVELRVVLTREEAAVLESTAARRILRRWGIGLGEVMSGEYVQVDVTCVPALLERLARKDTAELTRLLKLYLPELGERGAEIDAVVAGLDGDARARVQALMPREMVELANSKACRGAIMFEDKLDAEQSARLVARLADTRTPWVCAHGRPTFVPACAWPSDKKNYKRPIDWAKWKHNVL
ncbi:DNA mismatch repair protein MLH3 [Vanrija pseudolonga]|uniref:DNA mismatch repair protein MLH3 n=1 Tax=Vanrija pseudolonga TaxID=143232 RepID=A0AAF0Y6N8_9TREE|nr:DNA mismatch repair protein MLH3 [Vanrija pseudolonga]WOO77768.1 DNA mismatch repair protein MLH3 [Vanrija pseudolonga]